MKSITICTTIFVYLSFFVAQSFALPASEFGCCQFQDQKGHCKFNAVSGKNHCIPPFSPTTPRCGASPANGDDCYSLLKQVAPPTGNCPQDKQISGNTPYVSCTVSYLVGSSTNGICDGVSGKCVEVKPSSF